MARSAIDGETGQPGERPPLSRPGGGQPCPATRLPSGSLPQFEALLGFPAWFREGTGLAHAATPFPDEIAIADGMQIIGNICAHGAAPQVLAAIIRAPQVLQSRGWGAGLALAPSLGEALARLIDHFPTSNPYVRVRLNSIAGQAIVGVAVDALVPCTIRPFTGTGALFLIYRYVQPYSHGDARELVLETAAEGTPDLEALQGLLKAELHFGADSYRLRFPESWLNRRNPAFDPDLWHALTSRNRPRGSEGNPLTEAASTLMRTRLERGERPPPLAAMALTLGLSERTFVRRLTAAGTSYSRIIDGERRELAARLIADPEVGLQEIADRLAFGDRRGFARAFRAWFGESPGRYRRKLLSAR